MDIPNRQVTVGRSPDLPMGYSPCVGSIDIFDLETREVMPQRAWRVSDDEELFSVGDFMGPPMGDRRACCPRQSG